MDFAIRLEWVDSRIFYENLREKSSDNRLPDSTIKQMWKPLLYPRNNLNRETLHYTQGSSSLTLKRNGSSKTAPASQLDEAKVYDPEETIISMKTYHIMKFKCAFDFSYFPFDLQLCKAEVSHLTQTMSFLSEDIITTLFEDSD